MSTVSRVAGNTGVIILGNVVAKVINLIVIIYLARYLGDVGFGKFSFVFAYVGLFGVLTSFGIDTILVREISKDRSNASKLIGNGLVIKLTLSILSIFMVFATITFLDYPYDVTTAVYLASLTLLFTSLNLTYAVPFQVDLQMKYSVLAGLAGRIFSAILILILISSKATLLSIVLVLVASKFLSLALVLFFSRRFVVPKLEIDFSYWRKIIKPAIPIALSGIFITIFFRIDVVMLSLMKGDAAVGYYSATYRLTESLSIIPAAFMASMFPLMSRYFKVSRDSLIKAYEYSFKYMLILGLPIAVGTSILSEQIISLVYGTQFLPAIPALSILAWVEVLIFVNVVMGQVYVVSNRQNIMALLAFFAAILNIILNLLLIPSLSYIGASISTLITELCGFVVGFIIISRLFHRINLLKILWPSTISSAVMASVIFILLDSSVFVIIPVAAVCYFLTMLLLRGITQEDIGVLKKMIK